MAERLVFQELAQKAVGQQLRSSLLAAREQVGKILRPRMPILTLDGEWAAFTNMVGAIRLNTGDIAEVSPKVDSGSDWAQAVVQLLEPDTRIAVSGSTRSKPSKRANDLTSALALEYSRRLEAALRGEGPVSVYERRNQVSRRLNGHLDVTRWVRSSLLDPTVFPVSRDELTVSNDFTRGMSLVSGWLGRVASGGQLSSRLRRLQAQVIPGHAVPTYVDPSVALRSLPTQWRRYQPAWDIAAPLLRNMSITGDPGRSAGLEVAVEPWALLETALTRSLRAFARQHDGFEVVPKSSHPLLTKWDVKSNSDVVAANVVPDGMLTLAGKAAATFECKYTVPGATPISDHLHQALATAAAVGAPRAVLIHPGTQPLRRFETVGFDGGPRELVTVGLDLFGYRRGSGDSLRANIIGAILCVPEASGELVQTDSAKSDLDGSASTLVLAT